jgi:hypothetical protein
VALRKLPRRFMDLAPDGLEHLLLRVRPAADRPRPGRKLFDLDEALMPVAFQQILRPDPDPEVGLVLRHVETALGQVSLEREVAFSSPSHWGSVSLHLPGAGRTFRNNSAIAPNLGRLAAAVPGSSSPPRRLASRDRFGDAASVDALSACGLGGHAKLEPTLVIF